MKKEKPIPNKLYKLNCDDYMGDYTMFAEWIEYKGQPGKGRWMTMENSQKRPLTRKEKPSAWSEPTRQEFMDYYGLGEEDMWQDI